MRKLCILLTMCQLVGTTFLYGQTNIPTSATAPVAAIPKASNTFYYPDYSPLYQRTIVPWMPLTDTSKLRISMPVDSAFITTEYIDPLGRAYETVIKGVSPTKKDFVSFNVYDEFNRSNTNYLPFTELRNNTSDGLFKTAPIVEDSAFYKAQFPNENIYYGVTNFDASPLQRYIKTTSPGNSWTGANVGISFNTRANAPNDSVRLWTISISTEDDIPTSTATYSTGSLLVSQMIDERGVKSVIYTDELGRKILVKTQITNSPTTGHDGWLCTYYVYDELSHLRTVIPPKAVSALNNATVNWNLSSNPSINTNLCFAYWYDNSGRVIMKRVPGKGKTYFAYDLFDRPVLSQDANLRVNSQWSFISYDSKSRPDSTGIITLALNKDTVIAQASRSGNYPSITGTYVINTVTYYDDYNWISANGAPVTSGLVSTNINSTNFNTTYNTSPQYAQQILQTIRTKGAVTGTRVIIVGTNTYLWTVNIYDDKGRIIQTKQTNYTGGTDVATVQYNFTGRLLSSHLAHQKAGTNAQTHSILTMYGYDHVGRLTTISKSIDNSTLKTTSSLSYNEMGQLTTKTFGSGIETQTYSYNIRGWLLGINSSYVNTAGSTSNYFGENLSYDYGFTNIQLNGGIAGVKWKAAGDGTTRAYGFTYDNTNRLTTADFSQQNSGSTSWTKDLVDFTVNGLTYDGGGNILSMKQRGVVDALPTTIDSLTYQYFANSNQIQKIADGVSVTAPVGDFKDTSYTGDDYVYDANGNIVKDYNRHMHTSANANGAIFNYLDKPDSIVIANKGSVRYYYDASGLQLKKQVNDLGGASRVYVYLNGFVYVNDTLQYILHEDGQVRYARKINSNSGAAYYAFEYDYFIKDHLGNIRTVLTEGRDTSTYAATMESIDSVVVAATFSNVYSPTNTVEVKPSGFDTDPTNQKVSRLNASSGTNKKVGPSIVLKVMAGDQVQISSYAYYNTATQAPAGGTNLLTDILSVLGNGIVASSGGKFVAGEVTNINTALNPDVASFLSGSRPYNNTRPKAYLTWILFDNQFNYVAANSSATQVLSGSGKQALSTIQNISKNGYLYVYVSNESPQDVFFDNITVKQITGPLQQEQSFYPFGLQMAAISDKALLKKNTAYKFNDGSEFEDDYGLSYYNTDFRKYDPQVGRFNGVDALSEDEFTYSPYQFGGNDPIYYNDPSGLKQKMHFESSETSTTIREMTGEDLSNFGEGTTYGESSAAGTTGSWDAILSAIEDGTIPEGRYVNLATTNGIPIFGYTQFTGYYDYDRNTFYGWVAPQYYQYQVMDANGVMSTMGAYYTGGKFTLSVSAEFRPYHQSGWDYVPVIGNTKEAADDFTKGRWGWGIFHSVMAISDVFMVKGIATSLAKGVITSAGKYALKKAVAAPMMSMGEAAAMAKNPGLEALMKGKGIDRAFRAFANKNFILNPAQSLGLIELSPMNKGADMVGKGLLKGIWWDVTTAGRWNAHVAKYGAGGIPLLYTR